MKFEDEQDFQDQFKKINVKLKNANERQLAKRVVNAERASHNQSKLETVKQTKEKLMADFEYAQLKVFVDSSQRI